MDEFRNDNPFAETPKEPELPIEESVEEKKPKKKLVEKPEAQNTPDGFVLCKVDPAIGEYRFFQGKKLYEFKAPDFTCLLPVEVADNLMKHVVKKA